MSYNSSGSPPRYSPSSASTRRSPLPPDQHSFPSSGHHAMSHSPRNYLSPASVDHHPSTYSTTGYPPVAARPSTGNNHTPVSVVYPATPTPVTEYHPVTPFLCSDSVYAKLHSTSVYQQKSSIYQDHLLPQPPVVHKAQLPLPPSPSHHLQATSVPYPNITRSPSVDSLPSPRSTDVPPPPIAIHELPNSTYQNCLAPQQRNQGPPVPRGPNYYPQYFRYQNRGMFSGSHNLSFSDNMFIDNSTASDNFMKEFLQHTIIGAEFDSSDRHPPPRCHPGTRLAIIKRCQMFIVQCKDKEKMRWVVGPAGVGKSAVMQIVAEETPADASVFFSVNGRQDGTKLFTTIAYQLAAKHEPYRQFIQNEVRRDPTILRKSVPVQFQKFIVDPFMHMHLFESSHRHIVIIDGLDECDNRLTQHEILRLISDFCIAYPSSSIVWFVASRPEPHITSFFDNTRIVAVYTKEEILIDSDESCQDVQRYLREELNKIKDAYSSLRHKREWPSALEFTKIATASGGLFAYASTVVRYIGDPYYQDPVAQLRRVLEVIECSPMDDALGRDHPMAQLDALYKRILVSIPPDVMTNARKVLLVHSNYSWQGVDFRLQCNRLGLSEDAAYGAVRHLHAVVKVPAPEKADDEHLEYFHKSFKDFLFDFKRSGFSHDLKDEVGQLQTQSAFRIVEQVADDSDDAPESEGIDCGDYGYLKGDPADCDSISLSWPGDERFENTDDQLRLRMYCSSLGDMCHRFEHYSRFHRGTSCFRILTTRFTVPGFQYPVYELRDSVFDKFRSELTDLGKLKQVPLRALDYAAVCGRVDFRFMGPIGGDTQYSDPWNPSCGARHDKRNVGDRPGWSAYFERFLHSPGDGSEPHADIPRLNVKAVKDSHWESTSCGGYFECLFCSRRFARLFIDNPDRLVTVFVDATEICYVEMSFVDPGDGVSEWRYRFLHSGPPSYIN